MSSTLKPLHVDVQPGARYSLVRGPLRKLLTAGSDVVATWSPGDRGYLVRTDRVGDLLVLAKLDGRFVVRVRHIEQLAT